MEHRAQLTSPAVGTQNLPVVTRSALVGVYTDSVRDTLVVRFGNAISLPQEWTFQRAGGQAEMRFFPRQSQNA
jgi:hypothetical protein